ncbi:hypothetical protein C8J56DRAFT_1056340 [Mycena floridula]|nr:hypothetical protein C8J56DRAFT_1056340 [Mycena floridula]
MTSNVDLAFPFVARATRSSVAFSWRKSLLFFPGISGIAQISFSKFRVDPQPVPLFNNGPEVSSPDGSSSWPNPYPHPGTPPDHRRFSFRQAM